LGRAHRCHAAARTTLGNARGDAQTNRACSRAGHARPRLDGG
jgi:hypothetical protein